jgi:hypothetical protein
MHGIGMEKAEAAAGNERRCMNPAVSKKQLHKRLTD